MVQTFDQVLHRLNIADTFHHEVVDQKDHMIFVLNNSGRNYSIRNKNAKVIEYDIIDKIMKGISIDTTRSQNAYNRLTFRQLPANLKPTNLYHWVPQSADPNSSRTIWRILNRTIYREEEPESWQRVSKPELTFKETEIDRKLAEFGLSHVYPEEVFYKTHKLSKADFLLKLEEAESDEDRESLIDSLWDDDSQQGRKGVLSLQKTMEVIEKKKKEGKAFPSNVASLKDLI